MSKTLSASVRLRPTRIGFLVRANDSASLRDVMKICTCLWGGMFNPIIPVCESVPECWNEAPFPTLSGPELAHGYIRFFEPDVFVEAEPGLADQIGFAGGNLGVGEPRLLPISAYLTQQGDGGSSAFGITVAGIYQKLYERDFRFITREGDRVTSIDNTGPDGAFIDATFGGFPADGWLHPSSDHYQKTFNPLAVSADAAGFEMIIRKRLRFPLSFTREGLTQDYGGSGRDHPTIFVADPDSPYDLIDLWNLRLFHSHVLPASMRWFVENRDLISEFINYSYHPLPGNRNGVMTMPTLQFGRSVGKDRAEQLVAEAKLSLPAECHWVLKLGYDSIWRNSSDEYVCRPQPVLINAAEVDNEITLSDSDDTSVRVPDLAPDFATQYGYNAARWINVVRFGRYGDADRTALVLPLEFDLKTDFRLRLGDPAFVAREGFVLPQRHKRSANFLRLPDGTLAIVTWLKARGVTATMSDAGRVAEQVLRALGGTRGATLVADKATLQLLDRMAKSVRRHSDGTIGEFEDRAAPVAKWKAIISQRLNNSFSRWISLDAFINSNIFKLGLSLKCPHCLKRNWTGIGSLQDKLTCARCLNQFDFPQGALDFDHTPWQYRVVGPFSVPDYAGGAYATVLALRTLATMLSGGDVELTYSSGLELVSDAIPKMEVDFAGWYRRRRLFGRHDEPDLFFGEAKSFGSECFKQADVDRMAQLATSFPQAFIIFAMLKDDLSEKEKSSIGQLALRLRELPEGRQGQSKIIVLTGVELFADWRIEHTWEKIGGKHAEFAKSRHGHLDYLQTLADATQQLYLNLPDPWDHLRQISEHRQSAKNFDALSNGNGDDKSHIEPAGH